jgi:DNA-binding response OmpR family regulator
MSKKIMVADDDLAILDATMLMLELEGYEVITVTDGRKVLELKDDLPDLLLLDIWMSGVDGKEICSHLKQQELTKHIPIVMVSASHEVRKMAFQAGADDFLAKPFEMDDLLNKVKKNLNT